MPHDEVLQPDVIERRLSIELPRWRLEEGQLSRRYQTSGWKGALMAANAVGHLAELAWHHPDLLLAYGSLTVRLMTHSANGITDKDFELARRIEDTLTWRPLPGDALEGTPDDDRYRYIHDDRACR